MGFAYGAFLGLLVGDASGATLEFKKEANESMAIDAMNMPGGGPYSVGSGQITAGTSNIKTGLTFSNNLEHYFSFITIWIQEASGHSASCGVDEYKRKINNFLYRNFKNTYSVQLFSYSFIQSLFQIKYHYYTSKKQIRVPSKKMHLLLRCSKTSYI
eukprot:NODE_856_length_3664_cov_0.279102.p3 type:complete len:157 gc:universal NODE_856_length_3664_cov_0.279102:3174-2704(-)